MKNNLWKITTLMLLIVLLISACQTQEMVFEEDEVPPVDSTGDESAEMNFTEEEVDGPSAQPGGANPSPDVIDLEEEVLPPPVVDELVPPSGEWIMTHGVGSYTCAGTTYDFPSVEPERVTILNGLGGDAFQLISENAPNHPLLMIRIIATEYGSQYVGSRTIEGAEFTYTLDYFGDGYLSGTMEGTTIEENCDVERILLLEPAG